MELIVMTSPDKFQSELAIVNELFKAGLMTLHIRKTKFPTKKLQEYIEAIPSHYHDRIVIHSHHKLALKYNLKGIHLTKTHRKNNTKLFFKLLYFRLRKPRLVTTRSFHQLETLQQNKVKFTYVFLNPMFSKIDLTKNSFDVNPVYLSKLIKTSKHPVYASGNITLDNLELLKDSGVEGITLSKALWQSEQNKVELFTKLFHQVSGW